MPSGTVKPTTDPEGSKGGSHEQLNIDRARESPRASTRGQILFVIPLLAVRQLLILPRDWGRFIRQRAFRDA